MLSGHVWIHLNRKSQSLYEVVHLRLLILDQSISRVLVSVSYEKKTPKINQAPAVKKVPLKLCHLGSAARVWLLPNMYVPAGVNALFD